MKPVTQTKFGLGNGNCLSACVASLLECPVEEVPDFCEPSSGAHGSTWLERVVYWLAQRDWSVTMVNWEKGCAAIIPFGCWVICLGPQAGGVERHAVIGKTEATGPREGDTPGSWTFDWRVEYVHDPNPKGTFLTCIEDLLILTPRAR